MAVWCTSWATPIANTRHACPDTQEWDLDRSVGCSRVSFRHLTGPGAFNADTGYRRARFLGPRVATPVPPARTDGRPRARRRRSLPGLASPGQNQHGVTHRGADRRSRAAGRAVTIPPQHRPRARCAWCGEGFIGADPRPLRPSPRSFFENCARRPGQPRGGGLLSGRGMGPAPQRQRRLPSVA